MKYLVVCMSVGMLMLGCGTTATFLYTVYGLDAKNYEGKLLGHDPTGKDDLELSVCKPDPKVKGKCVVLLSTEYFKLKSDYLDIKQKLIDLQKVCNPLSK